MKTIKRSTLRELTRLVRERAKHPERSGRLWEEAVSVSMMLSRQATGNDSNIMEFAELVNAIAGRFGIKPDCTDEQFEELFKWLGFEIDESEYGRWEYIPQTLNTLSQLRCPFCGWWSLDPSIDGAYNYCPNCGARMDGGDSDG